METSGFLMVRNVPSATQVVRKYSTHLGITRVLMFVSVALATVPGLSQSLVFNETAPQFGSAVLGQPGELKTLSISNVSHAPVLIQTIAAAQDFTQTNNCKTWLAEGSGCLIFVTFAPQAAGPRTGRLTVALVGVGEQSISLNGFGLAPQDAHSEATARQIQAASRTDNNEEKAQKLSNDKQYSFQGLLNKNPGDVANSKVVLALTSDTATKQRIASILLSIGVKDQVYFDYLTDEAKKALAHDHDAPWPLLYDEQRLPKSENPALVEWCKAHGVGFWDMHNVEYYEVPAAWFYLAAAGTPRAYDLLIKGLHSQNPMIAGMAAWGLAKLQDHRAIGELIATGRQVPGEARACIVQSLVYFDDPKAQAAAEELMPEKEKNMVEVYRSEMKKNGMRAMFQW
jgi:hypothetical protein